MLREKKENVDLDLDHFDEILNEYTINVNDSIYLKHIESKDVTVVRNQILNLVSMN